MTPKKINLYIVIFSIIIISACATYYTKSIKFQDYLTSGQLEKAEKLLASDKKAESGKNRLLHYFNRGYLTWLLGRHEESNTYLTKAEHIIEDQIKNYGQEALALLTNPSIKPYKAEDFEAVLLNFFMAMNYLKLNNYEDAIVECRRINLKLNRLNDKYDDNKNKYQNDAFAHLMMGLIYEADKDYNDAFIAYRNAYNVYKSDYVSNFEMKIPRQLKYDILRTAYKTGFYDEVRYYEKEFNIDYKHKPNNGGEIIFFWLNGFGPVKSEWSINFTNLPGSGGWITLVNEEYGLNFPFYIGNKSSSEKNAFQQLRFLRVAFPKYVEREPVYKSAVISTANGKFELELAENINEIAYKTLHDRMLREMGNSLLRLATKKAIENAASNQDATLGTIVSITNALTEKADTRNWQTLPYSISYARIPLEPGEHNIKLISRSNNADSRSNEFTFNIKEGKTYFHYFHTLDSYPPGL